VQLRRLLNIKTGGCPEDCSYCNQSSHHATGLATSKIIDVDKIVAGARKARDGGATSRPTSIWLVRLEAPGFV
jgi:biotin synthase